MPVQNNQSFLSLKKAYDNIAENLSIETCVLAISGGVDSMVLLDMFASLKRLYYPELKIKVVHFNHKLRAESDYEQKFVESVCSTYNINCHSKVWRQARSSNVEGRARKARYRFFSNVIENPESTLLVTAHHKNDQAETIMMRIIRGSSLRGMRGIQLISNRCLNKESNQKYILFRPLLNVDKDTLYQYANHYNINYIEDESNKETIYFRNRVRLELIPWLEKENPNILDTLSNLTSQQTLSYQVHLNHFRQLEDELMQVKEHGGWRMNIPIWLTLSAQERELYLGIFAEEKLVTQLASYHRSTIKQMIYIMEQTDQPNMTIDIGDGWQLRREYDYLYIQPKKDYAKASALKREQTIRPNNWYSLSAHERLGYFEKEKSPLIERSSETDTEWLFVRNKKPDEAYYVRHREPKDRIAYQREDGSIYHKKVARIQLDAKVPKAYRLKQWLLCSREGTILWLVGQSRSNIHNVVDEKDATHVFIYQKLKDLYN